MTGNRETARAVAVPNAGLGNVKAPNATSGAS